MSGDLLQTKLYVPRLRPSLVPRPHLIKRLNQGLEQNRQLTLISAPAGFGKTTLVADWLRQLKTDNYDAAWISLDAGDNDPARLQVHFIAALQRIDPAIAADLAPDGRSAQLRSVEAVLAPLINKIAARSGQLILVLDDYHLIKTQSIHDSLAFLVEHLPVNMHLVLATRIDPPLPLALLRGRGQLNELRLHDLRFEPGETAVFLTQTTGHELEDQHVTALTDRTEGWIAGLQLAAVSMRDQPDIPGFIRAFTGSHRYVMDYLVEEVWARQPEHIQQFLLQTAILERFTAPLCNAVLHLASDNSQLPIANSQPILEYLEKANLFIIPLDDERRWYRYHHLFADLLRKRLQQTQPDLTPDLHRRASEWFERNGQMDAAIEHALAAEDYEQALVLIEQATETTLMRSELATFLKWIEALPRDFTRAQPELLLYYECTRLINGRPLDDVVANLQEAETAVNLPPGQAATLRSLIAIYQGRIGEAVELSRKALATLPGDKQFLRNIGSLIQAFSPLADDDFATSKQAMAEVVQMGQMIGNVTVTVTALCALASLSRMMGLLREAAAYYQQALEMAVDEEGRPYPMAGMAYIGLGEIAREWNDLDAAERHLQQGFIFVRQLRETEALEGYLSLVLVRQAQGDMVGANDAIQKAQQLLLDFGSAETDKALVDAHQAWLWLAQGRTGDARSWAVKRQLTPGTFLAELAKVGEAGALLNIRQRRRWAEYVTLARLWIALERPGETLPFLERLQQFEERMELEGRLIGVLAIKALALQADGKTDQAVTTLEYALTLAEPEGYIRIFLDEGPTMVGLLRRAASRGTASNYARELLAAVGAAEADRQPVTDTPQTLIDALSERELEVLPLLRTSLSVPEIAEQLFIAPSTVRSHIKSIYSKLGVHRRWDAVTRAEEIGLL